MKNKREGANLNVAGDCSVRGDEGVGRDAWPPLRIEARLELHTLHMPVPYIEIYINVAEISTASKAKGSKSTTCPNEVDMRHSSDRTKDEEMEKRTAKIKRKRGKGNWCEDEE